MAATREAAARIHGNRELRRAGVGSTTVFLGLFELEPCVSDVLQSPAWVFREAASQKPPQRRRDRRPVGLGLDDGGAPSRPNEMAKIYGAGTDLEGDVTGAPIFKGYVGGRSIFSLGNSLPSASTVRPCKEAATVACSGCPQPLVQALRPRARTVYRY